MAASLKFVNKTTSFGTMAQFLGHTSQLIVRARAFNNIRTVPSLKAYHVGHLSRASSQHSFTAFTRSSQFFGDSHGRRFSHRHSVASKRNCMITLRADSKLSHHSPSWKTDSFILSHSSRVLMRLNITRSHPFTTRYATFSRSRSTLSRDISRTCWKCGRDTNPIQSLFFCECGVVQEPADSLTYFDVMQEGVTFDLDLKALSITFKKTQKSLHPDMFSTKSQDELRRAELQSSLVNKAYNTLQRPLSRAIYMLKLLGMSIDEKDTISDPEFLMEIMDINEKITDAESESDIDSLERENSDVIAKCIEEISKSFKSDSVEAAKNATIKLRYYTTIQERINELRRSKLG